MGPWASSLQSLLSNRRGNDTANTEGKDLPSCGCANTIVELPSCSLSATLALSHAPCYFVPQLCTSLAEDGILLRAFILWQKKPVMRDCQDTSKGELFFLVSVQGWKSGRLTQCPELLPPARSPTGLQARGHQQVAFNKTMVCVATSDLCSRFPTRVKWLFLEFVIQVPNPTQEMDFNFFAGCSLGGYLIRLQLQCSRTGVDVAYLTFHLLKNYDYDLCIFLWNEAGEHK